MEGEVGTGGERKERATLAKAGGCTPWKPTVGAEVYSRMNDDRHRSTSDRRLETETVVDLHALRR